MSQLTDEQMEQVRQWCADEADLATVQQRIAAEFDIRLTYLDTRMLLADLGATAGKSDKELEREATQAREAEKTQHENTLDKKPGSPDEPSDAAGTSVDPAGMPTGGKASVSVSSVTPPGMIVAGTVTFSDGKSAEWYLDQLGRLGMNPQDPSYKPSEADLMAFQKELQQVLKKQGF
jgi:hypothetical protein